MDLRKEKPVVLVTNDDGIESRFLHLLVEALMVDFDVLVAAPHSEQSWIGRAMSRRRTVRVDIETSLPVPSWRIDGSPTDCVNIALGQLLDSPPDLVVSGINIGYNTSIPLIFSSGTIAGAMEGAFWGIPAIAVSQEIPDHAFEEVTESKGKLTEEMETILRGSARHTATFAKELLNEKSHNPRAAIVHNLNYPAKALPEQPIVKQTVPAKLSGLSFYHESETDQYSFKYDHGTEHESADLTDREAIKQGFVSWTLLNFSDVGGLSS